MKDIEYFRQRLLALDATFTARTARDLDHGRDGVIDSAGDSGDTSVADETASEAFAEAELDSTVSGQVRDALRRIQDGTYGLCVIDNLPIEPARLEAVPWTPYCLKHQESIEAAARSKTSTL